MFFFVLLSKKKNLLNASLWQSSMYNFQVIVVSNASAEFDESQSHSICPYLPFQFLSLMLSFISSIFLLCFQAFNNLFINSSTSQNICKIFLQHLYLLSQININGRLGSYYYRLSAFCNIFSWIIVSATRQRQGDRVC